MAEEWRNVPGWPDYQASDQGNVRSLKRQGWPILKGYWRQGARGGEYLWFTLRNGGRDVQASAHYMVLFAFSGPRPVGLEARHLNGDSTDNRPSNLAWGTHAENNQDRVRHGTHHYASAVQCKWGHKFDVVNTYIMPDGRRACRVCRARRERERQSRIRFSMKGKP